MKLDFLPLAAVAAAFIAHVEPAQAAIALDFGAAGQDVQGGFFGVSGSSAGNIPSPLLIPPEALSEGEAVAISSSSVLNFRDRGNITNDAYDPYPDLFEDFVRAGNGMPVNAGTNPFSTLTISVGQLLPLTPYRLTIRLYDGGMAPTTAGTYSFAITGTGDTNQTNNDYSVTFPSSSAPFSGLPAEERNGYSEVFLSDAFGNLQMTITQTSGVENTVPLNSFELVIIPEPSCALLGSAAGLLLLSNRRRRAAVSHL